MEFKNLVHKAEMSEYSLKAVEELAHMVGRTMGPGGLPQLIERKGQALNGDPLSPMITKDGVTVAQNISHPDAEIDLVIQTVKAIAAKTNKNAGDGTTTATVLGHSILKETLAALKKDASLNPQIVRLEIEKAIKRVKIDLKNQSKTVEGYEDIKNVATISANGEASIGDIIAKAFDEVGTEGVITIDEGSSPENTLEIVDGYQFGRGAQAQNRFFNDENNTKWEAEDVRVITYNGKLNAYQDLIPAFELLLKQNNNRGLPPLLVIADEFSQQVIQFLLMQRAEMGATICAVRSPSMTITRTNMLEDIAVIIGGERLGVGTRHVNVITEDDIGIAKRIIVTGTTTTIYDGYGADEEVIKRIDQLKAQKESAPSEYDRANISDRIAALSQGIAKIGVGGTTELEMKERYHRIEDALNAARSAVEGGIIPGGGAALYRIALDLEKKTKPSLRARVLSKLRLTQKLPKPNIGDIILSKALKAPMLKILENSGVTLKSIKKLELIKKNKVATYDALNHITVDAYKSGIIDPLNVTLSALENATSIATLLATCGGGIVIQRPIFNQVPVYSQVFAFVKKHRDNIILAAILYYVLSNITLII